VPPSPPNEAAVQESEYTLVSARIPTAVSGPRQRSHVALAILNNGNNVDARQCAAVLLEKAHHHGQKATVPLAYAAGWLAACFHEVNDDYVGDAYEYTGLSRWRQEDVANMRDNVMPAVNDLLALGVWVGTPVQCHETLSADDAMWIDVWLSSDEWVGDVMTLCYERPVRRDIRVLESCVARWRAMAASSLGVEIPHTQTLEKYTRHTRRGNRYYLPRL
jgi:hypothetical protein